MSVEYSEVDLKVKMNYEDEPAYGMSESTNLQTGEVHQTMWDAETNTRVSRDIDSDGNVSNEHSTDQNYPKGDSRRH